MLGPKSFLMSFLTGLLIFQSEKLALAQVKLPEGFVEATVASGMSLPVGMSFLPDGRILVVEKGGQIRLVIGDFLKPEPLLIMTEIDSLGQRGLLGIAVDPNFPLHPYIYVHFSNKTPHNIHIARFTLSGDLSDGNSPNLSIDPLNKLLLIDDIPDETAFHSGGTLRFGLDGTLYISIGEDSDTCAAQDLTQLKGKILRIKVDHLGEVTSVTKEELIPPDNPFLIMDHINAKLVWAYGLRNPFRFSVDPETDKTLWIGDVGAANWEEMDLSTGGENFGWPFYEAFLSRSDSCPDLRPPDEELTFPIDAYKHVKDKYSVIGGPVYHGVAYPHDDSFPPRYEGNVFFADFFHELLWNLRYDRKKGKWERDKKNGRFFGKGLVTPADMAVGPDGALYYVSLETGTIEKIRYVGDR